MTICSRKKNEINILSFSILMEWKKRTWEEKNKSTRLSIWCDNFERCKVCGNVWHCLRYVESPLIGFDITFYINRSRVPFNFITIIILLWRVSIYSVVCKSSIFCQVLYHYLTLHTYRSDFWLKKQRRFLLNFSSYFITDK